jgi:hypothetical protein
MNFGKKNEAGSFLLAENNFGVKTGVASVNGSDFRSLVNKMP